MDTKPPVGDSDVITDIESMLDDIIDEQEEILDAQQFKME